MILRAILEFKGVHQIIYLLRLIFSLTCYNVGVVFPDPKVFSLLSGFDFLSRFREIHKVTLQINVNKPTKQSFCFIKKQLELRTKVYIRTSIKRGIVCGFCFEIWIESIEKWCSNVCIYKFRFRIWSDVQNLINIVWGILLDV